MKKIILTSFILIISAANLAAQTKTDSAAATAAQQASAANFKSDGCSLFPNGDYLDCCVQHDSTYFKGGNWTARWRADSQLRKCVAAKDGWWHKPVSLVMWSGVRIGGVPFLPTTFRWGFGKEILKKQTTVSTEKTPAQ